MYELARKRLENETWLAKKKPWKSAVDPKTQRKYVYNTRTQQSQWFMPILERETGTSVAWLVKEVCTVLKRRGLRVCCVWITAYSLDYSSFFEMCVENNLLLSTYVVHDRGDFRAAADSLVVVVSVMAAAAFGVVFQPG